MGYRFASLRLLNASVNADPEPYLLDLCIELVEKIGRLGKVVDVSQHWCRMIGTSILPVGVAEERLPDVGFVKLAIPGCGSRSSR